MAARVDRFSILIASKSALVSRPSRAYFVTFSVARSSRKTTTPPSTGKSRDFPFRTPVSPKLPGFSLFGNWPISRSPVTGSRNTSKLLESISVRFNKRNLSGGLGDPTHRFFQTERESARESHYRMIPRLFHSLIPGYGLSLPARNSSKDISVRLWDFRK